VISDMSLANPSENPVDPEGQVCRWRAAREIRRYRRSEIKVGGGVGRCTNKPREAKAELRAGFSS